MNLLAPTPSQSVENEISCFSGPMKPSVRALLLLVPLCVMLRASPLASRITWSYDELGRCANPHARVQETCLATAAIECYCGR